MSYILKLVLLTFLFANYSYAALKELPKGETQKLEQLELLKKNSIKINKAFDIGSLYMLNIVVKGNNDEVVIIFIMAMRRSISSPRAFAEKVTCPSRFSNESVLMAKNPPEMRKLIAEHMDILRTIYPRYASLLIPQAIDKINHHFYQWKCQESKYKSNQSIHCSIFCIFEFFIISL